MLTGACMSRAGLNRKTGLATATLVLAAEASDLDVFYGVRGPVAVLQHHRGWTHSFVAVPVMAGLAVLVVWAWNRLLRKQRLDSNPPVRWGVLYAIALLGPLSHILLDYTTAYGIRMFEPFSYKWYEWDIVSIIEPFMLGVLILGLVLPYLFGLINEEIGARQPQFRGRTGAIVALAAVVLMWGVRDFYHRRSVSALEQRVYQGQDPVRVSAYPYALNPFVWHGVVETRISTRPCWWMLGGAKSILRITRAPTTSPRKPRCWRRPRIRTSGACIWIGRSTRSSSPNRWRSVTWPTVCGLLICATAIPDARRRWGRRWT